MTVSFVGAASAEATSLTLPAHQAGDLIVIFAWNGASTTQPVVPTGWLNAYTWQSSVGSARSGTVGYRHAGSSAEVSGTWANAQLLGCVVYRHITNLTTVGGINGQIGFNGTTITHQVLGASTQSGTFNKLHALSSYILRMAACTSNTSDIETPPSGYTNRVAIAGVSANELVIHESNTSLSTQAATNQTINQTVVASTVTVEILDTGYAKAAAGGLLLPRAMDGGYAA